MSSSKISLGKWGEEIAADYLIQKGYSILDRNARTPYGEIDLVARQELEVRAPDHSIPETNTSMIVFVEVKTRTTTYLGYPEQAIDARKRERMLANAQSYLQEHPELEDYWRLDVIAVRRFKSGDDVEILHFENVIT